MITELVGHLCAVVAAILLPLLELWEEWESHRRKAAITDYLRVQSNAQDKGGDEA